MIIPLDPTHTSPLATTPPPDQHPQTKTYEPKHRAQKRKRLSRIPPTAHPIPNHHLIPRPDTTTIHTIPIIILQQAKGSDPSAAKDKIADKIDDVRRGGKEPEEGCDDRYAGYHDAVDEAAVAVTGVHVADLVEEDGCQD